MLWITLSHIGPRRRCRTGAAIRNGEDDRDSLPWGVPTADRRQCPVRVQRAAEAGAAVRQRAHLEASDRLQQRRRPVEGRSARRYRPQPTTRPLRRHSDRSRRQSPVSDQGRSNFAKMALFDDFQTSPHWDTLSDSDFDRPHTSSRKFSLSLSHHRFV